MLIVVALLSHITLDWWNSYGVHPFWPVDDRWYYGDAINIFEPLLWVLLGIVVSMNSVRTVSRVGVFLLVAGGTLGIAIVGLIRVGPAITAEVIGIVLLIGLWRVPRRTRAAISLGLSGMFVVAMFGLSRAARAEIVRLKNREHSGPIVDVILTPTAANPLCWSAVTIEHDAVADSYTLGRGRVALFSGGKSRAGCATGWSSTETQSIAKLRQLETENCRVAAWLQFGRAPMIEGTRIFDYRFGASNFTDMSFADGVVPCPRFLTPWRPPREDLF